MKKYLSIVFIFAYNLIYSQSFKEILFCNDSGDSIFKHEEVKSRDTFFKIVSIDSLKGDFIFRSWAGNSCVEIIAQNGIPNGVIHFATKKFSKRKSISKIFTATYSLDQKVVNELYQKIKNYRFERRTHDSGKYPVVHTFIVRENFETEIYTTDVPKFETEIFNIIPMDYYLSKFEKEIPFKKFIDYDTLKFGDMGYYQTKRNG